MLAIPRIEPCLLRGREGRIGVWREHGVVGVGTIQQLDTATRVSGRLLAERPAPRSLRLSVVCPFYNEERIIERAALAMHARLSDVFGDQFELILVDDGSTDRSLDVVTATLEGAVSTRVISYPHNQGRGRALKTGIDAARGDIVVTTEADGSWGEDIVERLVAALDAAPSVDFVIASPHRKGGGLVNVALGRALLSRIGNRLIRSVFESKVTMNTGMTRAYRRRVIQPLVVTENGKEFHLEVLLKLLTLGFNVSEIPATITWDDRRLQREPGAERRSSTRILRTVASHLKFVFIAQPFKYFALFSVLLSVIGLVFMGLAVRNLFTDSAPSAYLALAGLNLLLFTLVLIGFSVVLFQIREMMRESWMRSYGVLLPPSAKAGVEVLTTAAAARKG